MSEESGLRRGVALRLSTRLLAELGEELLLASAQAATRAEAAVLERQILTRARELVRMLEGGIARKAQAGVIDLARQVRRRAVAAALVAPGSKPPPKAA